MNYQAAHNDAADHPHRAARSRRRAGTAEGAGSKPVSTCSFAFQVGLAQRRHGEAREHAGERRNRQLNMASRTWFHFAFVPNYDVRGTMHVVAASEFRNRGRRPQ